MSVVRPYLFAGSGNSSIWIPDLMAFVQYNVVPIETLQSVLHIPHSWVRRNQDAMTFCYFWNKLFLQKNNKKNRIITGFLSVQFAIVCGSLSISFDVAWGERRGDDEEIMLQNRPLVPPRGKKDSVENLHMNLKIELTQTHNYLVAGERASFV